MDYSMQFLIVDNLEIMRRLIAQNLYQLGFKNFAMAANGLEALRILHSQPIHVMITDWNMPVMDGLELVKEVRADPWLADLPVLMVTGEALRHQVEIAIEAGVSDIMVKPFTANSMEAKLTKIFSKHRPEIATKPAALPSGAGDAAKPAVTPTLVPHADTESLAGVATTGEVKAHLKREATLLVIDDVPDNLDVLVALLDDEYCITVANSGKRALKMLESGTKPDLILLDVMMPEMDGFEVCRRLKANPATVGIPVIFLTVMGETTNVTQGLALGAVDYISKPADPPILKARIRTQLKLKRSFDEINRNQEALQQQNVLLEENARLRGEVDRIARHDLKNPIGGIINFSSILLEDVKMSYGQKEIVKDISQAAYSALNMINLSLDLYKMEQGSYEFHPCRVDIAHLLGRILNEHKSELKSHKITGVFMMDGKKVRDHDTFYILGDELLSYSMFSNLLKNAMEASGEQQVIRVDLDDKADHAVVSMMNHGTVPRKIRANFFDKFVSAGKHYGTGMGTYSSKLIAEIQGGSIAMSTSDRNTTTTITVMLPCPGEDESAGL